MEIGKKKIFILSLGDIVGTASGKMQAEDITDYRIVRDVVEKLRSLQNLSRLYLITDEDIAVNRAKMKAIELFIFIYLGCKVAVSVINTTDGIMEGLPHNMRKADNFLTTDKAVAENLEIMYSPLETVLCTQ